MKKTKSTFAFVFGVYILMLAFGFISTLVLEFVPSGESLNLVFSFFLSALGVFGACYIMSEKYFLPTSPHRLAAIIVSLEIIFALVGIIIGLAVFQGATGTDTKLVLSFLTPDIIAKALGIFLITALAKTAISFFTFTHFGSRSNELAEGITNQNPT